jgi:multiple sugar transport system permease protein
MVDMALPGRTWRLSRRKTEAALGAALSAPAVATMIIFIFGPLIAVILFSFTDWQLGRSEFSFASLENYAALFRDPLFWLSLGNTLLYVVIVIPVSVGLGLIVALVIEAGRSGRDLYQTIHFLPVLATTAAMALSWEVIFHPIIGVANALLGLVGLPPQQWLNEPGLVIGTLAIIGVWQHLGFAMVLFVAGLRVIPPELHDAAEIDGADGVWDRFATVTWPLLGPVTVFVVVLVAIRAFEVFDIVAVLTRGGPGESSHVILYTIYREGFSYLRTGYAAALTVVFLIILFALTVAQVRLSERRVHYV